MGKKDKAGKLEMLRPETKKWIAKVKGDFILDSHHEMLLLLAARAFDRANAATEDIFKNGQTYLDRFGVSHSSPSVKIEYDASNLFTRLLRELCLDISAPESPRIPSITKGIKCR